MKTILITGATGLIGTALCKYLQAYPNKLYDIRILTREKNPDSPFKNYLWNIEKEYIEKEAFEGVDTIIHLAGENIGAKRWTEKRKKEILDSRVKSTALLVNTLKSMPYTSVKTFISASAIGFYGETGQKIADEETSAGHNFMAEICEKWEFASLPLEKMGIRRVIVRNGIVLSTKGRTLNMMMKTYPLHLGVYAGMGGPYISWIHILDICHIYKFLIEHDECAGVFNAVSPNPEKNYVIAQAIAVALNKKSVILPIPAFLIKLGLGEMSEVLLSSLRVTPKALQAAGFSFEFKKIVPALKDLIEKNR